MPNIPSYLEYSTFIFMKAFCQLSNGHFKLPHFYTPFWTMSKKRIIGRVWNPSFLKGSTTKRWPKKRRCLSVKTNKKSQHILLRWILRKRVMRSMMNTIVSVLKKERSCSGSASKTFQNLTGFESLTEKVCVFPTGTIKGREENTPALKLGTGQVVGLKETVTKEFIQTIMARFSQPSANWIELIWFDMSIFIMPWLDFFRL